MLRIKDKVFRGTLNGLEAGAGPTGSRRRSAGDRPLQAGSFQSRGKGVLQIRPIRPDDEERLIAFHGRLSDQAVYMRYLSPLKLSTRIAHERIEHICYFDPETELVLVAVSIDHAGEENIVGVGRLNRVDEHRVAEFAIIITDAWQRCGLGTELLRRLVAAGRTWGLEQIIGEILPDNSGMLAVCRHLGFSNTMCSDTGLMRATLTL